MEDAEDTERSARGAPSGERASVAFDVAEWGKDNSAIAQLALLLHGTEGSIQVSYQSLSTISTLGVRIAGEHNPVSRQVQITWRMVSDGKLTRDDVNDLLDNEVVMASMGSPSRRTRSVAAEMQLEVAKAEITKLKARVRQLVRDRAQTKIRRSHGDG